MNISPGAAELGQYLDFATELAREAGRITLKYFRQGVEVESKADASPVTIADRQTEQFIRERIKARYPAHGVLGEEYGEENPGAALRWIIDPIDGTQAFVHGIPLYTVLLALEFDGDTRVGVIHNPALDETACAATGLGCRYNGAPCHVSQTSDLSKAWVQSTNFASLARRRPKFCQELLTRAASGRTWADAHGYLLVATGRSDAMIDPVMSLWDVAPLRPIILEAGGRLTDLDGKDSLYVKNAVASNGALHEQLLALARLDETVHEE